MKILIFANNAGGLYGFRRELLLALIKEYEVIISVPPDEDYAAKLEALGCQYIPCTALDRRGTNPIGDLKLLTDYCAVIRSIKPDVVLTYTIKPNVYGGIACGMKKVPYIANVTGLGDSIENGGLLSLIAKTLYKTGLRKARCVFFQNQPNRELFQREKLIKGKTRLIPGSGVNLEQHCPEFYPDNATGVRFLFVGRVMKDKGVGELLQAMRSIHEEFPNASLDIIGGCEEDYSQALKQAERNAVRYHGPQSDVHSFYKNCHCVVLPSYHEGTSNVLLEASATARPVITTRVPGCQETFDEGVTGLGCEAKDAESLLNAMRNFLCLSQDEREKMGLAARAKMEREYDRNIVIRAYMEEIKVIEKEPHK